MQLPLSHSHTHTSVLEYTLTCLNARDVSLSLFFFFPHLITRCCRPLANPRDCNYNVQIEFYYDLTFFICLAPRLDQFCRTRRGLGPFLTQRLNVVLSVARKKKKKSLAQSWSTFRHLSFVPSHTKTIISPVVIISFRFTIIIITYTHTYIMIIIFLLSFLWCPCTLFLHRTSSDKKLQLYIATHCLSAHYNAKTHPLLFLSA